MLFNSNVFLFGFLPVCLIAFYFLRRFAGAYAAQVSLTVLSIVFYAWSGPQYVPLLLVSIAFNYMAGRALGKSAAAGRSNRALLAGGVAINLLLLAYFKYAGFIDHNLQALTGYSLHLGKIALPVGISFYTFTQIAFLVDAARGEAREYDLSRYGLFVTFFPHLIAGPIIHHKEMMPQFAPDRINQDKSKDFSPALTLFAIGLFKKVVLADTFATYVSPVFNSIGAGAHPDLIAAWVAALAYTFQIYFDFSGYSDMALGLALMFGIRLPVNFLSPYQSNSIIEFWRRWHITLSRFLRDYLYFPLGGNRHGRIRRYVNLMIVMLLGGLWHGAGWTFVIWGGLHGFYLVVNHFWEFLKTKFPRVAMPVWCARAVTFLCVVVAWVVFRAPDMGVATGMYGAMLGFNGIHVPAAILGMLHIHSAVQILGLTVQPLEFVQTDRMLSVLMCVLGFIIAWGFPNSMAIAKMSAEGLAGEPVWWGRLIWRPAPIFALLTGLLLFASLREINAGAVSEFIYFQF